MGPKGREHHAIAARDTRPGIDVAVADLEDRLPTDALVARADLVIVRHDDQLSALCGGACALER